MRIAYKPTDDEVRQKRRAAYLLRFPVESQLEALTEAAQGRPEKMIELTNGLAEIRESIPFERE